MKNCCFLVVCLSLVFLFYCSSNKIHRPQAKSVTPGFEANMPVERGPQNVYYQQYLAPQRIVNFHQNTGNKRLFNTNIYSRKYLVKLKMSYSKVLRLISPSKITVFSKKMIYKMILYKFILLKSNYGKVNEYARAFNKVKGISVISVQNKGKKLILFFYKNSLYSIKMRFEGNVSPVYQVNNENILSLPYVKRLDKRIRFGKAIIIEVEDNVYLENHFYTFDNSAECTLYDKNVVRKIEKLIRTKMSY